MSKNRVKWHPYPQERPKKGNKYIVTIHVNGKVKHVTKSIYHKEDGGFFGLDKIPKFKVIAWTDIPDPYNKGEDSDSNFAWHPYPEEPAWTEDYFLVTIETEEDRYTEEIWTKDGTFDSLEDEGFKVTAWAEFPEPYNPEEDKND